MEVVKENGCIRVYAPYSHIFRIKAPHIGGTYVRKENGMPYWRFPESREPQLRQCLLETYAENGLEVDMVDIDVDLGTYQGGHSKFIMLGDMVLASRGGRDRRVDLNEKACVVEGCFLPCGGSRNHPAVTFKPGTVVRVKYPESIFRKKLEGKPGISLAAV